MLAAIPALDLRVDTEHDDDPQHKSGDTSDKVVAHKLVARTKLVAHKLVARIVALTAHAPKDRNGTRRRFRHGAARASLK